jgi:hypothetical protein
VKFIGNSHFLVYAPLKWKEQALSKGYVVLGDVSVRGFRVDAAFPQDRAPLQVWVKITDMPFGLCNKDALTYLVREYATLFTLTCWIHLQWNLFVCYHDWALVPYCPPFEVSGGVLGPEDAGGALGSEEVATHPTVGGSGVVSVK